MKVRKKAQQGMHFEQFSIVTNAAVAGLCVALLPRFLIKNELQRGELQVVCNKAVHTEGDYYLVIASEKVVNIK
ncbi:LysR substrate-binding domain-containing protein [Colwellia psychrerythraea]|uniref:LysR substrate-binding protein n=1 Tax=Colwellia psychrerythraea TaxID=28229 RepID=A0A099L179_COLPS|nr:LysR substrate-binding domain-containing protein [Colwellia psychrerythraea]KGJ96195.1 LysR substrate-binding protein [Colwellia psychrerythraea]